MVAYNGCFPMPFHSYEAKPIRFRRRTQLRTLCLASGGGSNEHSTASSRQRWMFNLYIFSFSIKAGMDSEILLRSVPTVFSSPSRLGMIQAFKLADQIMGFHPRRGKLVGWLKCGIKCYYALLLRSNRNRSPLMLLALKI